MCQVKEVNKVTYGKGKAPTVKTVDVMFTKNAAMLCSLDELGKAANDIPIIRDATILTANAPPRVIYKPAKKQQLRFFESENPVRIRTISLTPRAEALRNLCGTGVCYLVVIYGSCLELLDGHSLSLILNDKDAFEELCALWAIPETLIPMFKSLCVVAKESLGETNGPAPAVAGV